MKCKTLSPFARQLRAARGKLLQEQAARRIGVPLKTYVNWEQGRNTPDAFKRRALLRAL